MKVKVKILPLPRTKRVEMEMEMEMKKKAVEAGEAGFLTDILGYLGIDTVRLNRTR